MQAWSKELALLKEELEKYKENIINHDIEINKTMNSAELMDQAQQFFNEMQIQLHDVPILNRLARRNNLKKTKKYILALEKNYFKGKVTDEIFLQKTRQIFDDFLNRICKIRSPYHIPITRVSDEDQEYSYIKSDDAVFQLKRLPICISVSYVIDIFLSPEDYCVSTLVRLLVCSQFLRDDPVYAEVLPNFFELLYKDGNESLLQILEELLIMLSENQQYDILLNAVSTFSLEPDDELVKENQKGIIGAIYAIGLYDVYQNSNMLEKEKMMREIQTVFDSEQTIEDFLKRFDFEEQIEVVKQYCKK